MILKAFSEEYFYEMKKLRRQSIVFFNGCFDLLHVGHYKLISEIKRYAHKYDYIIICGLNSDESVSKQNKNHPLINDETTRAKTLEALGIENVFIFDEEKPTALIMSILPNIIFKGSDYRYGTFDERNFCVKAGIEFKYIDLEIGHSSTNIYNKIKSHVLDEISKKVSDVINEA